MNAVALCAVLFVLGAVFLAAEAFLPGVPLVGALGAGLMLAGAYVCWRAFGALAGVLAVLAAVLAAVGAALLGGRFARKRLYLRDDDAPAVNSALSQRVTLVGAEGVAETDLRPGGTARLDGRRVHVVSESAFVLCGARVTVTRADGGQVFVREADAP